MSIFGKVLAFLNILAALGFLLFAILDWGARANWQYTNWRYDLYSNGLPLDNTEKTLDGDRIDEMLDQKTLSDIFTTIGGSPQKTQVDEVKRVQPIITTYITAAPSAAEKQALTEELQKTLGAQRQLNDIRIADLRRQIDLAKQAKPPPPSLPLLERELKELEEKQAKINSSLEKLNGAEADSFLAQIQLERRFGEILLPFATTSVEYEEMVRHKNSTEDKGEVGNLKSIFDGLFDQVLKGSALSTERILNLAQAPASHTLSVDERKLAAARLLFNLIGVLGNNAYPPLAAPGSTSLGRLAAVCGPTNAARAIDSQAQTQQKITDEIAYAIEREKSEFVAEERRLIARSQDLADELRVRKRYLALQQDLVSKQQQIVGALQEEINSLNKQMTEARVTTDERLKIQAEMEASLVNARKQLRDLGEENLKLEQQIRDLEAKLKAKGNMQ
jgi:hypothetical protein